MYDKAVRRPSLRFNELEIKLALSVMKKMKKPIELMYYLLKREDENPFVIIFISAEDIALKSILKSQKRDTDILFKIDKSDQLYALICQETKVDGAYRFSERILRTLKSEDASNIYCTQMEVRTTRYDIKDIIFKAIESYINAKKENKESEIIFKTL